MTPLLVACSFSRLNVIEGYIALGADATALDKEGHNALWHLYHPVVSSPSPSASASPSVSISSTLTVKRIIASEVEREICMKEDNDENLNIGDVVNSDSNAETSR